MSRRIFIGVLLILELLFLPQPSCSNSDNLALLSGTLKTMQRAACDDEIVSLSCPRGTSISIQVAQYGKTAPEGHTCQLERSQSHPVTVEVVGEKSCLWPNSMQYSLLQTVVEACQKKPQCKFSTTPKSLVDPCPAARKFVEVAFKCRPYEFRSRTGCEDDVIKLSCNPHSRVAIFDAQYGRTAYESIQCPQTQGVTDETCIAPYAVEKVMQLCHGKRRCQVAANSTMFGNHCKPESRTYLKIIYTCVSLGVLTERYESAAERDEIRDAGTGHQGHDENGLFDESDGPVERWDESKTVAPAPAVVANSVYPPIHEDITLPPRKTNKNQQTSIHSPNKTSGTESNGKVFIYVGVGVAIFLVLVLLLIAVRCYIIRRDARKSKSPDMFTTDVPNVFNDAISDVDNDIDVSHISGTFYDPVHPDMILYRENIGAKGTLRAMRPLSTIYPCAGASMYGNVDYVPSTQAREPPSRFKNDREDLEFDPEVVVSPKSLGRYSNSQFYYG